MTCALELCTQCVEELNVTSAMVCTGGGAQVGPYNIPANIFTETKTQPEHSWCPISRMAAGQVQSMLTEVRSILDLGTRSADKTTNDTGPMRSLAQQHRVAPVIRPGQDVLFRSLWSCHIPVIVAGTTSKLQCTWSPDDFVTSHGDQRVNMIKMHGPKSSTQSVTVEHFFDMFRRDSTERGFAVKIKVPFRNQCNVHERY